MQSDELTQSKIYQMEYQKALKKQVEGILDKLHGEEYGTLQQYLKESYTNSYIGTVYDLHGQGVPLIMPIDQDAAVKVIIHDSPISEGYYKHLGVDIERLKKSIKSEITRGIATGLPYGDIARNINNVSKSGLSNAQRIARTEGHRIQEQSRYEAQKTAKSKGANVVKQWDSTMDGVTRETHRVLDGQIRELDEYFEADGKKAMYPSGFGRPEEDINCRCVSLTRARWDLDKDELNTLKQRAEFFGLDKTESFEDFKGKYLKSLENNREGDIIELEMLKKLTDERSGFAFISDKRFNDLTINARKNGAVILRGTPEVEAHLDSVSAAASTVGDVFFFRTDVCVSEVLEETWHFNQNMRHLNDDKVEPFRTILNEIDAKQYIIDNASKYGVPRNEIDLVKKQLEICKKLLSNLQNGR